MYQTQRLLLREWRDSDLVPFINMGNDPVVMKYFPSLLTESDTIAFVERIKAKFIRDKFSFFAVELLSTNEFIGFIGLNRPDFVADFTPCVEIGWRISPQFWGNGYATEGAKRCLEIAFQEHNLKEVVSFTYNANHKSRRVMERIGMRYASSFFHPKLDFTHQLSPYVLYRIKNPLHNI